MSSDRWPRPTGLPRLPRTVELADNVLNTLAARWPLTVIRGPRGYGKTSALAAWLSSIEVPARTIYLPLTSASNRSQGFWEELHDGLIRSGLLPQTDTDSEKAVGDLLASPEPLTLILDNFHEAGIDNGAAEIDERLMSLLQQNKDLFVVTAGRMLRSLEAVGSHSVETAVIGPKELRLTGPMVHRLAGRLGVELSLTGAEELADELGGWPSAIRAGLFGSAGHDESGSVNRGLIDDYIATTVREARFENVRLFVLRTAIPDEFDVATARAIDSDEAASLIRLVHSAGLLSERFTADGPVYVYPPAVRRALRRLVRESYPEIERGVHLALMRRWHDRDRPALTLLHAAHAGEWQTALGIVDSEWRRMLIEDPLVLTDAARLFPTSMATESPRLTVALEHLAFVGTMSSASKYGWSGVESPRLNTEVAAHRADVREQGDDELVVLTQWGITSMMMGNLETSLYAFSQARACAMREGEDGPSVHVGTAGLALVHALMGEPDAALQWLADPALEHRLEDAEEHRSEDVVRLVAATARALAHVDRADPEAARSVAEIPASTHRDELWALGVFVRALHVSSTGTVDDLAREANQLRGALRHLRRGSLVEAVLTLMLIKVLVLAERTPEAREIVDRWEPRGFTWIARAILHGAEGAHPAAAEAAARVLQLNDQGGRYALPAAVLLATAHHGSGRHADARDAFRTAVQLCRDTGRRTPFSLMPRHIFDALASEHGSAAGLWPYETEDATPSPPPVTAAITTLTAKEVEILQALPDHAGPVGIAHALGLSTNTVKTHLRAVYRKLGVTSREEALAVSGQVPARD
ncbi:LuxR C-terminal-related transcriptional regulator [Ruania alba]|uniref:Regulatory protein, luxR family n=1 Tax=Ruania alba TaxID=648782 RepID=A0A1H5M4P1_9MICO|nr:LuxR C-terminal-related transcriptional regulator [Ruania alba]SEE84316.1 regulatory protein, luxR family [Ruania alba]